MFDHAVEALPRTVAALVGALFDHPDDKLKAELIQRACMSQQIGLQKLPTS